MALHYFAKLIGDGKNLQLAAADVYLEQLNSTLEAWANSTDTALSNLSTTVSTFLTGEDNNNDTLDRLSELVAAINDNKDNIDDLLEGYIDKDAIVNNLTTNDSTKVLSAAQGYALDGRVTTIETWKSGFSTDGSGNLVYNNHTLNGQTGIAYGTSAANATDYTGTLQIIIETFDDAPAGGGE